MEVVFILDSAANAGFKFKTFLKSQGFLNLSVGHNSIIGSFIYDVFTNMGSIKIMH